MQYDGFLLLFIQYYAHADTSGTQVLLMRAIVSIALLTNCIPGSASFVNIHSINVRCLFPNGTYPDAVQTLPPTTSPSTGTPLSTPKQPCTEQNPLPGLAQCDLATGVWRANTNANNQTQTNSTVLVVKSITLVVNGSLSLGGGLIADTATQVNVSGKIVVCARLRHTARR